jgi:formylglycine-generating enzyme required for sulfatase activity
MRCLSWTLTVCLSCLPFLWVALLLAQSAQPGQAVELPDTLELDLGGGVNLKLVRIPARGKSFWMGSPEKEDERDGDEVQHEVTFQRDFYLAVYETTQEQYQTLTQHNPSAYCKGGKLEKDVEGLDTKTFPVERVSWEQARAFCDKLTAHYAAIRARKASLLELTFRLPTEAEWEYACRGGASNKASFPFHFKDGPIASLSSRQANFNGGYPYGGAARDK